MVWELELCMEVEKSLHRFRLSRLVEKLEPETSDLKPGTRNQQPDISYGAGLLGCWEVRRNY